jgi:hypothetical protein
MFKVYVSNWWKENPDWPNGLEPDGTVRHTLKKVGTEAEARAVCEEYNATHAPGRLSRKAEYTEIR